MGEREEGQTMSAAETSILQEFLTLTPLPACPGSVAQDSPHLQPCHTQPGKHPNSSRRGSSKEKGSEEEYCFTDNLGRNQNNLNPLI